MAERPYLEDCWIMSADLWPERGQRIPGGSPFRFSYAIGGNTLNALRDAAMRRVLPAPTPFEEMERMRSAEHADSIAKMIGMSIAQSIVRAIGEEMAKRLEAPKLTLPSVGVDIASVDASD